MTKHIHRQIVVAFSLITAVCIALTVSFYIFSRNGTQVQHEEAAHSLEATAETARNIVNSHIQGNLQTLVTLSAFIGYDSDEGLPPQQLLHDPAFLAQLDVVNSQNAFLRMGVVDTAGQGSFVLLDGSAQLEQDLSQDSAVQRALAGEGNISFTFWDDTLGCYVNRYAVPIYQGGVDGPVIGVLTGTNNTDALRELLSPSLLLNGQVHAHIVNSEGKFVVRNQTYFISEDARSIFDTPAFSDELQQTILSAFAVNESAFFSLTNERTLYEVALIPMDVNDWYIMCVVPQRILVTDLSQWFNLQRITFFVIFLLVILLTLYIYRMMRQNNRSMNKLTYFDSITGAYNRVRFLQEMPSKLTADPKALIVLDIDNAPTIKDLYGLERFNSLLRHIKEALDQQIGPTELFCMGRNERFLLLLDCSDPDQVHQRMSRFFAQIRRFRVSEHQNYQAVCSAGVRFVTNTTPDLERAITEAAMTAETTSGSRQDELLFFDPAIYEPVILRNQIEESMDAALMSGEFVMKLQPKIDLVTGRPGGAEALVRWVRPDGLSFYPDQFIPVFEKNGFCVDLDFYMVDQACRTLRRWLDEGRDVIPISVNQCRLMLYEAGYVQRLCSILNRWNIPPRLIVLEVTESLALESIDRVRAVLLGLHGQGFSISMDDFGSGYSSLNTLKDLPIDELKLDRVFLAARDETDEEKRDLVLKNVIHLAQELHITTVVEGVETEAQLDFIRRMHCDLAQGYYFDRPISVEEFEQKYLPIPHPDRHIS